jgi:hypothetical protein
MVNGERWSVVNGEGQSGFQRIVVKPQVHVSVAGAFLDAQRVDGLVSSAGRVTLFSGFHQRPIDDDRVLLSTAQLPTCASAKISNGEESCGCGDVPISPTKETRRACTKRPSTSICRWVENGPIVADRRSRTQFLQNGVAATELRTTRFTCRTLTCEGPAATAATSVVSGPSTARRKRWSSITWRR